MPTYQLPLQIKLDDSATFANFFAEGNEELLGLLEKLVEPYIYIWSSESSGKTHLLQALCHSVQQQSIYLPLKDHEQLAPELFDGLEQFRLICLDDVQSIVGLPEWEQALFGLYNRVRDAGGHLCVTGAATASQLNMELPDLVSRLNWGPVFSLHALSDTQKISALKIRSRLRGFEMPNEVAKYMLGHYPRDMHSLFAILDRLDDATLQAQRKVTIPFIKQYL